VSDTREDTATPERGRPGSDKGGRGSLPSRIALFFRQVVAELRKVIWPTRRALATYTGVVIAFVLALTAIVAVLDVGFGKVVLFVFGGS